MIRLVVILLALIVLVTVLRYVIGFAARAVANFLEAPPERPAGSGPSARTESPAGGELKRDPVCGTFVASAASIQRKTEGGKTLYFCSEECVKAFERSKATAG